MSTERFNVSAEDLLRDIQKNVVQVKVALDDPPSELRPDMLCRVRIGDERGGGPGASRQRVFAPEAIMRRPVRNGATCCAFSISMRRARDC